MKTVYILAAAALLASGTARAEWGTTIDTPVLEFPADITSYANEVVTSAGYTWSLIDQPVADPNNSEKKLYEFRVQCFDSKGEPQFAPEGMLVSNYENLSFTLYNHYLTADRDGNAIVMISDCRNSSAGSRNMSLTAYKITPQGENLWGDDGAPISDPLTPSYLLAAANCVQLEDGSYLFAWNEFPTAQGGTPKIYMQRYDAQGKAMWENKLDVCSTEQGLYPMLINSGANTAIIVYGQGGGSEIYARKIDVNGEDTWTKPVRIYRGGWGQAPFYSALSIAPSGNGGVLVAWHDDRNFTNVEKVYLSYVTPEGKLAFSALSDEGEARLDYEGYRSFTPSVCAASDGKAFYVAYRVTSQAQAYQGVKLQKVSPAGELLFGEEALWVMPFDEGPDDGGQAVEAKTASGYISVQPTSDGGACVFYGKYYAWKDQQCFAQRYSADGKSVWEGGEIPLSPSGMMASDLKSRPFVADGFTGWQFNYTRGSEQLTYCMNLLNENGTLGLDGNAGIQAVEASIPEADGPIVLYTIDGRQVGMVCSRAELSTLTPGLYITRQNGRASKIAL